MVTGRSIPAVVCVYAPATLLCAFRFSRAKKVHLCEFGGRRRMSISGSILIAIGFSSLVMFCLWLLQLRTRNAGIVDVAWPFLTALTACWLIIESHAQLEARQWLLIILALLWGVRLGSYLKAGVRGKRRWSLQLLT